MAGTTGGVYVPLDSTFCDTTVSRQVVRQTGYEGFHAYVKLLCTLLGEPGGRLPYSLDSERDDLADRLGVSQETCGLLISLLEHYGAIVIDSGSMTSPMVMQALSERDEIRRKRAAAGRAGGIASGKSRSRKEEC